MNTRQQGFALVSTLLIAAVVGTLVTASLVLAMTNRRISSNDAVSTQALNVAQAGNAFWKAELVSVYRFMMEHFELYEDDMAAYQAVTGNPPIACDNYFAIGIDLNRDGTIDTANASTATKKVDALTGKGPKPLSPNVLISVGDTDGEAQVSFYIDGSAVGLRSRGTFSGSRATVTEEFTLSQSSIWNNAIFTSTTAADATIQGRAEVRGSVHVLGEGVSSSTVVLDVSGNFGLGNTYEGLVSSVAQDVTASSNHMRLTNQRPADLCAALRVKNGVVKMNGSSTIGYTETTTDEPYKDLMSGIYTNYGITGGSEGSNVHSKNGMTAKYDVGDLYDFPDLIDYTTDFNYTTGIYPFAEISKRWQDKLKDNSLVLATGSVLANDDRLLLPHLLSSTASTIAGLTGKGKTYLSSSCTASPLFGSSPLGVVASSAGYELKFGSTPFRCQKYRITNLTGVPVPAKDELVTEVVWTGDSTQTIKVNGVDKSLGRNELYIGGTGGGVMFYGANLNVTGGNNNVIGYYGKGVLFAEDSNRELTLTATGGNIKLEVDFVPAANNNFGLTSAIDDPSTLLANEAGRPKLLSSKNTYPATALIGVVARRNVITDGSQKRLSTSIYAQEEVAVNQQVVVAGSIVAPRFDAGSQVPTVLYVPNVPQNLSRLMPGTGGSVFSVSNTAWNRQ